jgi:hypothetical protein
MKYQCLSEINHFVERKGERCSRSPSNRKQINFSNFQSSSQQTKRQLDAFHYIEKICVCFVWYSFFLAGFLIGYMLVQVVFLYSVFLGCIVIVCVLYFWGVCVVWGGA